MRINNVHAVAFGPLVDETLALAPGMTVVVGDNESAKSSWHAAVYAALCGRRRGKGAPAKDEKRFIELHRPWDGDKWAVSTNVTLDDGRVVEIYQDLDGKVDCRALDMSLGGRDISNEIIFEGSPDGSRWLGLDRRSFSSTACVSQTELLRILEQADGLQEHLQRAAATAGTDATAAAAISRLDMFIRDRVGLDRSNSSKPLHQAKQRRADAENALVVAREAHGEYLALVTNADKARRLASKSASEVALLAQRTTELETALGMAHASVSGYAATGRLEERAQAVARERGDIDKRLTTIVELDERFAGHAPVGTISDDDNAQVVTSALAAYAIAPRPSPLTGATSADLQMAVDSLPDRPAGDIAVDQSVRVAASEFDLARVVHASHIDIESRAPDPLTPEQAAVVAAGVDNVRDLAAAMSATPPVLDPALQAAVDVAIQNQQATRQRWTEAYEVEQCAAEDLERGERRVEELEAALAAQRTADEQTRLAAAAQEVGNASRRGQRIRLSIVGVILMVGGLGVFLAIAHPAGAVVAGIGLVTLLAGFVRRRTSVTTSGPAPGLPVAGSAVHLVSDVDIATAHAQLAVWAKACQLAQAGTVAAREESIVCDSELASSQARLDVHVAVVQQAEAAAAQLRGRCVELQLPDDPGRLRDLAAAADRYRSAHDAYERWQTREAQLQLAVGTTAENLARALDARAAPAGGDLATRLAAYERDCSESAEQSAQAGRREPLERELAARRESEQSAAEVGARHSDAERALRSASGRIGLSAAQTTDPDALVIGLHDWQEQRVGALADADQAQESWAQLQALLDGHTAAEIEDSARDLANRSLAAEVALASARTDAAEQLCRRDDALAALGVPQSATDPSEIERVVVDTLNAERMHLADARERAKQEDRAAADVDGALRERARVLPGVAEAEESLQAAEVEWHRVTELDETLQQTKSFLDQAQQRVHRDIAPVLAKALSRWLPDITGGRYVEATVDPQSLQVRVCGAARNWRDADRLSHGTAEQVYLLLRVALAQHLVAAGTTCPLLLDDVTVQADSTRTTQILELLHRLSGDQQIVLFAQQKQVADWAHANLTGSRDAVVEVATVATC